MNGANLPLTFFFSFPIFCFIFHFIIFSNTQSKNLSTIKLSGFKLITISLVVDAKARMEGNAVWFQKRISCHLVDFHLI